MLGFLKRTFDTNERELRRLRAIAEQVSALEPEVSGLSNHELASKTFEFKTRLDNGETLDELLPEAFAVVREAAVRVLDQRHFDEQIMGGVVLHEGRIAEMKTGEGKTLAATLPAYLNALTGKGVHIVTVNDYLARRDAEWMGTIYKFLGLKVGVIIHGLDYAERRAAYSADITYGTNNEFGFDYLRDNMVASEDEMVQGELNYAIVDEVDSILIDEARTPLIISGQAEESTDLYRQFARLIPRLKRDEDYTVDEKANTVALTDEGVEKAERMLGLDNLSDESNIELMHHLNQALRAHALMRRDRDYIVKDGQAIIVDEFTGRLMFGRRYSNGLHQAIEAKEGIKVERESLTLATITFQNYFRMYQKLAGMTGTAATEEEEFSKIYGLDVVVLPTHLPMIRTDHPDVIFKTEKSKFAAIVDEIEEIHKTGQPILVGTISIEKSERLSEMLRRRGIKHQVLNAKHHEREAEIVAQAGRLGAVTIATNMAGRGTDIVLGGNPEYVAKQKLRAKGYSGEVVAEAAEHFPTEDPEVLQARNEYQELLEEAKAECRGEHEKVVELGGLFIIGTERHESRRIDNQLRGRSGRQGDPGASRFYVSLEDDLMRLFGGELITGIMDRLGWEEDMPIEHPRIARSIETAQKRVEGHNFDIRKQVLEYDDVMNKQREVIYDDRRKVVQGKDLRNRIMEMMSEVVREILDIYANEKIFQEEWDLRGLADKLNQTFMLRPPIGPSDLEGKARPELDDFIMNLAAGSYEAREEAIGQERMRVMEKLVMLRIIDSKWIDHLQAMDDLREGIGLRAYGQKDPLLEYQIESWQMFEDLKANIRDDVVVWMSRVAVSDERGEKQPKAKRFTINATSGSSEDAAPKVEQRRVKKVGRNDPCPCGSGKKYKKCCGKGV
ncbi:MAG TPA: preprotein translocase subunit SecA [Bacillota bacterium]|nr:preprotein translocase subunit SecA [Bacillota bacterium]